jgi:hypothetical protein
LAGALHPPKTESCAVNVLEPGRESVKRAGLRERSLTW